MAERQVRRENHSTQHAIIDSVNVIQNNMDQKLFTCGIFLDLKKAFDTVDQLILLQKLNHYGIRGIINAWFASYLLGRSQVTELGLNLSTKCMIACGVPQVSVLGPLLFLIYINDIHNSSAKLSFYLFADDTSLLYADTNLKSLEKTVNSELFKVSAGSMQISLFICLFIFSSIYLFYKLFILYYKIEELKMLFVELNIRLQE